MYIYYNAMKQQWFYTGARVHKVLTVVNGKVQIACCWQSWVSCPQITDNHCLWPDVRPDNWHQRCRIPLTDNIKDGMPFVTTFCHAEHPCAAQSALTASVVLQEKTTYNQQSYDDNHYSREWYFTETSLLTMHYLSLCKDRFIDVNQVFKLQTPYWHRRGDSFNEQSAQFG